jgi:large subunit ribosomal protein L21
VTTDDLMLVNKLKPETKYAVGSTHTLSTEEILLMGSSHLTLVGLPHVTGGEVDIMVEEITRDESILVLKKRRRKHSRRRQGHRRQVTFVRVLDIRLPEPYHTHPHQERVL